jgi:hypothetical protein
MEGTTASKMDKRGGRGTVYNKEAGRNKGLQTHAKPPPAAPGDRDAPPHREGKGGAR